MNKCCRPLVVIIRTRVCGYKFPWLIHLFFLLPILNQFTNTFLVFTALQDITVLGKKNVIPSSRKKLLLGKHYMENMQFSYFATNILLISVCATWLSILLIKANDIHPNPGPSSVSSNSSTPDSHNISSRVFSAINLSKHLSFVHYNVQSISSKLDILGSELFDFDILAFSETWLNSSIDTEDLLIQSYRSPERKDRIGDSHGGVMIYVKENIHYRRRQDLEILGVECIWIELGNKHKHVLFGLFYRPPSSDSFYYSSIENSINLAVDTGVRDVIVTGDFNFNMLCETSARKISTFCEQFSLEQCINQPTHFTEHSSSLIDILLVSNSNHLILSGVGEPFLEQDIRYHCPVYGILNFSKPKAKSYMRHIWKYNQGNYALLRSQAAAFNWTSLQNNDINIYAKNLTDKIISLAKSCIPNKEVRIRPNEPAWITHSIKKLIRKRKRAYRKAKLSNLPFHWEKFKKIRNKVISLIRDSKKSLTDNLAHKLKSQTLSSKDWWNTLKKFISPYSKSAIPPLEKDGFIYSENLDKANLLNDYFRDQTVLPDHNSTLPDLPAFNGTPLSSLVLYPHEVESVLQTLPVGKAAGPDGINNRILKELSKEIAPPLCSIFNQSLNQGSVPDIWKVAHVCPIPKDGDVSSVSNHRPISLLSNIDKSFERIVFKYLYNHFLTNDILTPLQSGFVPGDSTVNQLTFLYNTFSKALDSGKEVRVIFCDISKAFDRVWHAGLLHKLKAAGVTDKLLAWFRDYLNNRKQRVVLPGVESKWNDTHAGVPQGSILGPLLFLLYINDIVNDIGSNIRLFADDTSLYIIVDNPDTAAVLLNIDMEKVSRWALTWLVSFNPSKNESLLISRKVNRHAHPPVFMQDQKITEVTSHKHLGVYFSNDCTWHKQIEYIKEKAWSRINVMRKFKFVLDRKSLEIVYTSFIRPVLEYGNIIWDNCTQQEKQDIEKIQLEAARIATGTTKLVSLNSLYQEIGWDTLESRRRKQQLTLFFKMHNNLSPVYLSSLVPPLVNNMSRYHLRNANDYQTIGARTNQYYHSFLPTVVREWNNLSEETKQAESVNLFKYRINQGKTLVPKHFYAGNRKLQMLHARLRTKCSSLNHDLFVKNIVDSPLCRCGEIENTNHFFFHCSFYNDQRRELIRCVSQQAIISLDILLLGDNSLSHQSNVQIVEAVHKYISGTKRF